MEPNLYIYFYQAGDRTYKLSINAYSAKEAISLRDQLLGLYENDASRLEEMLQENGIKNSWDYLQEQRKTRLQEVKTYKERKANLKLINQYVLVGEKRENDYYGRMMGQDHQGLSVFVDGEKEPRDDFDLKLKNFSEYSQQVTQTIVRIA